MYLPFAKRMITGDFRGGLYADKFKKCLLHGFGKLGSELSEIDWKFRAFTVPIRWRHFESDPSTANGPEIFGFEKRHGLIRCFIIDRCFIIGPRNSCR